VESPASKFPEAALAAEGLYISLICVAAWLCGRVKEVEILPG
jgi:hypothetical protein